MPVGGVVDSNDVSELLNDDGDDDDDDIDSGNGNGNGNGDDDSTSEDDGGMAPAAATALVVMVAVADTVTAAVTDIPEERLPKARFIAFNRFRDVICLFVDSGD